MPRLTIPVVILAIALSLTACATPAPPVQKPQPTVEPTPVIETGYEKALVPIEGESQCPAGYIPEPMSAEYAEKFPNQAVYSEIAATDFEPLSVGAVLGNGCILVSTVLNDDHTEDRNYQAYIASNDALLVDLDVALAADGYTGTIDSGVYRRNNNVVVVWGNGEGFRTEQLTDAGFVGDAFVVVMAYRQAS